MTNITEYIGKKGSRTHLSRLVAFGIPLSAREFLCSNEANNRKRRVCDCPTIRRVSSRPALLHQPRSCNRFSMAWDSLRLMPSAITHDKTNPMNTPIPQIPDLKTTPLLHITKMDVRASDAVITPTKKADLAFFRQVLNSKPPFATISRLARKRLR